MLRYLVMISGLVLGPLTQRAPIVFDFACAFFRQPFLGILLLAIAMMGACATPSNAAEPLSQKATRIAAEDLPDASDVAVRARVNLDRSGQIIGQPEMTAKAVARPLEESSWLVPRRQWWIQLLSGIFRPKNMMRGV